MTGSIVGLLELAGCWVTFRATRAEPPTLTCVDLRRRAADQ